MSPLLAALLSSALWAAPALETSASGLLIEPRELTEDQKRAAEAQGLTPVSRAYALLEPGGAAPSFKRAQSLRFNFADPKGAADPARLAVYRFERGLWAPVEGRAARREGETLSLSGSYRRGGLFCAFALEPPPPGAAAVSVRIESRTLSARWYRDPRHAWYSYQSRKERVRVRVKAEGEFAKLARDEETELDRDSGVRAWLEREGRRVILVQQHDAVIGEGEVRAPVRIIEGSWAGFEKGERLVFELDPAGRERVDADLRDNAALFAGRRGLAADSELTFDLVGSRLETARYTKPGRWTAQGPELSMEGSAHEIGVVYYLK